MLKHSLVLSLAAMTTLAADEGPEIAQDSLQESFTIVSPAVVPVETHETPAIVQIPEQQSAPIVHQHVSEPVVVAPVVHEKPFSPFTGKVKGKKVRMRVGPDLESRIVRELAKSDTLVVVGQKGDFYAVEPPSGTKAYVFRSFVLDGIIEGNRVNVRLEPSIDAPIISHLNSGDRIKGVISSLNNKWYEIAAPSDTRFYVAKEFVEYLGGPELKHQIDNRKMAASQLLDASELLAKAETMKPFDEMDISRIRHNLETVIGEYEDFPDLVSKAKDALASVQELYLQKKIAFLEERATDKIIEEQAFEAPKSDVIALATDRMKVWSPCEESLYLSWASSNDERSLDDFYGEQRQNGVVITGMVEAYTAPVKRKPGDFILRDKELPVAYLYSTQVNLQDYVGKRVTLLAAPRPNNNFAFPAYYVLSVE